MMKMRPTCCAISIFLILKVFARSPPILKKKMSSIKDRNGKEVDESEVHADNGW